MWMLDTNTCVFLIKQRPPAVLDRMRSLDVAEVSVSAVTVAELQFGVAKSAHAERNALALAAFLAPLTVEPFDDAAAEAYGSVRSTLERAGTPIGSMDLLIAAHALSLKRTLVTHNTREFRRVEGLALEDWVTDP